MLDVVGRVGWCGRLSGLRVGYESVCSGGAE